ncbi:hypothetical protein LSH36_530g02032 [Paralvinella palmiformis]|uniref:Uncharacterized protein n=1 Tax=Paralvinella palmiformis TaxID=53620 RepID=A0AAD9J853_9ANNE|nr:hypothetical protein LSH36_530g02032 [Paralvinella palmiformis]
MDNEKPKDAAPVLTIESGRSVDAEIENHLEKINKAIEEINTLTRLFLVLHLTQSRDEADKHQRASMTVLSRCDEHLANMAQHLSKYVLKARGSITSFGNLIDDCLKPNKSTKICFLSIVPFLLNLCKSNVQMISKCLEISRNSNFQEDGSKDIASQSLDIASLHSNGSTLDSDMSRATKSGPQLNPEALSDLNISDTFDINESNKHELDLDYAVSFQLNV